MKEARSIFFETPSVGDLFRAFRSVTRDWWFARFSTVEFRELRDDEVTDEMRVAAEIARNTPDEELINI